jgi:hypothetical protein
MVEHDKSFATGMMVAGAAISSSYASTRNLVFPLGMVLIYYFPKHLDRIRCLIIEKSVEEGMP